jgi:hypothetical protein
LAQVLLSPFDKIFGNPRLYDAVIFEVQADIQPTQKFQRYRLLFRLAQRRITAATVISINSHHFVGNAIVVRGIEAARGQYVALLDGDDYWVSPHKLQQQVELLDQHPEYSICFHNARVIHDDGSKEPWLWNPADQPKITTLKDILLDNYIVTSSTMFRKGMFDHFPAWYDSFFPITDWALHILNAEHGKIVYMLAIFLSERIKRSFSLY